jgi:hypothetical protein
VTLKISEIDLARIIRSFERYDITVKASFQRTSESDDMQFRYDALMNYQSMRRTFNERTFHDQMFALFC